MLTISKKLVAASLTLAPILFSAPSFAAEGSARINQVTRKSGGALYRVFVTNSVSVNRVSIDVLNAKAKIHSASLLTSSGLRIQLERLTGTAIIPAGQRISSEYINRNDGALVIEIQAESFGAVANLRVRAASDQGVPELLTVGDDGGSVSPAPRPPRPQPDPYDPPAPPYYPPQPTPSPTPTPPEVVYLSYPFSNRGNTQVTCSASDKGWEEHWGGHSTCEKCMGKHGDCTETCEATDTVVYGTGYDVYGRIAKFEGRGGDSYDARRDMQSVCDYYRLSRCESDSGKSDSTHSEVISRRSCR